MFLKPSPLRASNLCSMITVTGLNLLVLQHIPAKVLAKVLSFAVVLILQYREDVATWLVSKELSFIGHVR